MVTVERGAIEAVFYLEMNARVSCYRKKPAYVFCGPRKVSECAMMKKGIPEVFIRSVMSLYEGEKTRVGVDFELSEEFEVAVGMH